MGKFSIMLSSPQNELPHGYLHPNKGKLYNIKEREVIVVKSKVGKMKVKVFFQEKMREDVIVIHQGRWIKKDGGVNILTEDIITNRR